MALIRKVGDILSNWGDGNNLILLSGHTDLTGQGRVYLNNSQIAAVRNIVPDFDDIFSAKIIESKEYHAKSGNKTPFGFSTHKVTRNGELIQRVGLLYTRGKWNDSPMPDIIRVAFDGIMNRISFAVMVGADTPRILIQDPITADIKMPPKAIAALERLYEFYPPYIEIWTPEITSAI